MLDLFKKHKERTTLGGLLLISILSMWISGKTLINSPKELGMGIFSFFQNTATTIGVFFSNTFLSIQKLVDLQNEYNILVQKVQEYESVQGKIENLKSENESLRMVLGFSTSQNYPNMPAQIIGKSPGIYFANFTINKGFNNGIKKGMPVIAVQDGIRSLVGKVESVAPTSAQIQPLFNENTYVSSRLGNSRFEGLLHGSGSSIAPLTMSYVDLKAQGIISVGEPVITAGFNSDYPEGIAIGVISSIDARPYENSLELEVEPAVSYSKLEYVFVLLLPQQDAMP